MGQSGHGAKTSAKREKKDEDIVLKQKDKEQCKVKRECRQSEIDKHFSNIKEILECTNATPIRNIGDLGYSCCYCDQHFQGTDDLKQHTLKNHDGITNACFLKRKKFHSLYLKLDITGLCCKLCNEKFETVDDVFLHLKNVHERKIHVDIKNQIVPFKFDTDNLQCCICHNEFSKFRSVVIHMKEHYRNHVCQICDSGFLNQAQLRFHVRCHKRGSFKCEECDKVFDTEIYRNNHVRMVHQKKNWVYKCSICKVTLCNYRQKLVHMKTEHAIHENLKCNACDRTFWNQRQLIIHKQRDHMMERRKKCTMCEMSFYSNNTLKTHMLKHTGERIYRCDICLKSYGRKSTLREHMRIHADDRRFKCEHCGQAFVQKCSWRGHMRSRHGQIV